jgi:soluble lytic murein transglycosylase
MDMTMRQKLFFGLIALVALAPELVSRRAPESTRVEPTDTTEGVAQSAREQGVALAKRGYELHGEKKYEDAVARFDSAAQKIPQIKDWLNVFSASSLSFLGDTVGVHRRLTGVDSAMAQEWAWRTRARAFSTAKAYNRALEVATAAARTGGSSKRASALYFAAEMHKELGRQSEQRVTLLRAIELAPYSDAALDAARVLAEFRNPTSNERLQAGRALLRNGEQTRGAAVLRKFMEQTTNAELRGQVAYEIGSALFSIDSYQAAERELKKVPTKHARGPDARFLIGRSQYRQGKEATGSATFRRVVADFPRSQAATRALYFLGDLAQDDRRTADAIRYFKQTAARNQYGGSEPSLALMRLGTLQFQQKDYAEALKTFETYRSRNEQGTARDQATYWAAQVATALGKKDTARAMLEEVDARRSLSYYDVRAAQLLDRDFLRDLPAGPAPSDSAQARFDKQLERWSLLRDIGWNESAAFELAQIKRDVGNTKSALYNLADALIKGGHPYAGIATGRELREKGESWNRRLLRIMYPFPYQEIIERESRKHGLDPYFVAALMRQESQFNPRARSGAGAIGLMQVMPATGRQLGRGENVGAVTPETLTDPDINIRLGTKFLADLMRTWHSRPDAVLAAYNAGPSRMARWRSFPEFAAPDLFVERIPFAETRDYVRVVRVNTSIYHALYGD